MTPSAHKYGVVVHLANVYGMWHRLVTSASARRSAVMVENRAITAKDFGHENVVTKAANACATAQIMRVMVAARQLLSRTEMSPIRQMATHYQIYRE
jgi:hypothetical protein